MCAHNQRAFPVHGVHGISNEVFEHPAEKGATHWQIASIGAGIQRHLDVFADARAHVVNCFADKRQWVFRQQLCLRTDF